MKGVIAIDCEHTQCLNDIPETHQRLIYVPSLFQSLALSTCLTGSLAIRKKKKEKQFISIMRNRSSHLPAKSTR